MAARRTRAVELFWKIHLPLYRWSGGRVGGRGKQVRHAHPRPEFANATRHAIRVVVQFVVGVQRRYPLRTRAVETPQVEFLAGYDGVQDIANESLVTLVETRQHRECVVHSL